MIHAEDANREANREVEREMARDFLYNPLRLNVPYINDTQYHINKVDFFRADRHITFLENFLLGAGGHKRMDPESQNEHGVFIFLGKNPDTSEVGQEQIATELSNLVGRQEGGVRAGSILLAGGGFDDKAASRIAKATKMQVIFGKGKVRMKSMSATDISLKARNGLFVAASNGDIRNMKVKKVILPQVKKGINQIQEPRGGSRQVAGFSGTRGEIGFQPEDSLTSIPRSPSQSPPRSPSQSPLKSIPKSPLRIRGRRR